MKSLKPLPRLSKSTRGRSPVRKMHSSRKAGPSRSPQHRSGSGRPTGLRGPSPGMKRGPPPPTHKHSHSPRHQSIGSPRRSAPHRSHGSPVSVDRGHAAKRMHEYEKRRNHSRSPVGRRIPVSSHGGPPRPIPTHHPERHSSSSPNLPPPRFDTPLKKKIRREPQRHMSSRSPPRMPLDRDPSRIRPESHVSHRSDPNVLPQATSSIYPHSHRGRDYMPTRPAERPRDPTYHIQDSHREGFNVPSSGMGNHPKNIMTSMEGNFPRENVDNFRSGRDHREEYISNKDKHYGLTLDERFRSVSNDSSRNMEPRVNYTREDLEKITIDIRRNVREPSPTVRRIVNPSEVKLVRRPSEGHRPIFDREEIKQSPRDLREDAYIEQKMYSSSGQSGMNNYGLNPREMENYEITRHKFDSYHGPPVHSGSSRTLSDRWQKLEGRKGEPSSLDRDERNHGFENKPHGSEFAEGSRIRRSRSMDRDFRQDRFHSGGEPSRHRDDYPGNHRPLPNNPADLRHNLAVRRKDGTLHDARQRILERRGSDRERPPDVHGDPRGHYPGPERRMPESSSERIRDRSSSGPGSRMEPSRGRGEPMWERERSSDRNRMRDDKLPDFSQRPERFKYQPWLDKPDVTPKGPSYFEHDDREDSEFLRNRGAPRGFRSRGFRGRSFRGGPPRGSGIRGRGSFRVHSTSSSPRGRGYAPRRGRFSPGLWEHDMYTRMSQDHKPGDHHARP